MFARWARFMSWPDKVALKKPVAEKNPGSDETPYCERCVWLIKATSGYSCNHESNKVSFPAANSWLSPDAKYSIREHPKQKNRNNKCIHYKSKK